MKKKLFSLLAILLSVFALCSCGLYGDKEYTIVFETNGGNAIADVVLEWNDKIDYPVATKTGYTFTGWFSDPGCTVPYEAETLTENITLYAGWSVNYYNITFNANGGKFSEDREEIPKTYAFGTTFDVEKPIKEGYTFSGWYTTQDCKTSYGNKMKADFVTVYAKYMINQYTLSFEKGADNVSGEMDELTLSYNETITLNESLFSRPGYNFKGWATEEGGNVVYYNMGQYTQKASNTKLYAVWEAKNIEISYLSFGLEFASRNGTYGECVDLSLTPSKVGYTFKGWASSFTQTTDTSCDAKKMYYVLNGENYEVANISEFESGVTYYELIVSNQIVIGAKDLEVYAVFERNACSLTFNTNGASENITINTFTGLPIQAPSALSKEGNTFGGWYNNQSFAGDMVQFPVTLTTNVTLYAKWSQNAYVIKFVSIYSEETMADVNALYGENVQLPTNSFTRAGYTFKGWSLTDGNVVQYENGATVSNLSTGGVVTLYAIWQANGNTPYTVEYSFKTLEGTYVVNNSLTENLQGTTGAMTNAVYKEVTGFEAETETVEQVEIKGDGSTVVTLKYSRKNYTVSFKEGETTLLSIDMPYESEIGSYPQSLDKAGYSLSLTIGGNAYSGEYQIVGNTDVIAVYTANTYKISFTNVATPIEDMTVTFDTFVELPNPLKAGYAFIGWKLNGKLVELREEDEKYKVDVASNITLAAAWKAAGSNYTVKYQFESINDSTLFEEDSSIQKQEIKTGTTGTLTNVTYKAIENFTASTTPITQLEIAADGSTVITLKYTRNSYTVTFVEEGHENIKASVKYKGTISQAQADALKRNGYSLSMTASGQAFTTSTVVTSNVTVTLTYTANAYIISFFNANEEDINSSYGASETLPTPTKTGYAFGGWSLTDGGSKAYDGGQTITVENALNLYAIWNAENVNYTVKHLLQDLNDETQYAVVSTIQDSQVLQGLTGSLTNAQYLSIPHFTQSPDAITQKTIAGDGSTVIELKYTRDTYKVSYQEGGVEKAFKNIKYQGKTGVYPTSLNRTGYSLALTIGTDSYSDTYQVIADTTVVLVYTANEYHISFTGTVNPIETMTVHFGDKVTLPEQAKRGYAFSWLLNDEAITLTEGKYEVTQASDISLKASWVANSYKVKFVTDNANITYDDINATYDTEFTIPEVNSNPNIEHVFLYWTYTNGVIYEGATVKNLTNENNATITLTAVWSVNPRLISFYDASLSGTEWIQGNIVSIKTQYDDEAISVPSSPSKPGYNFVGWKNVANSEMLVNGITTVSGDATYVAVYEVATYSYEFHNYYAAVDGEKQHTTLPLSYNQEVAEPTVVSPEGYTFVGWYSDEELTKPVIVDQYATRNMKYYAKYSQAEASFSYLNKKNGSIIYSTNVSISSSNVRDTFISEYVQDLYTKTLAYAYIDQIVGNLISAGLLSSNATSEFQEAVTYFAEYAGTTLACYSQNDNPTIGDFANSMVAAKTMLSSKYKSINHVVSYTDLLFAYNMIDASKGTEEEKAQKQAQKTGLYSGASQLLLAALNSSSLDSTTKTYLISSIFNDPDTSPSIKDEFAPALLAYVVYRGSSMTTVEEKIGSAWSTVSPAINAIDSVTQAVELPDVLYFAAAEQNKDAFERVKTFINGVSKNEGSEDAYGTLETAVTTLVFALENTAAFQNILGYFGTVAGGVAQAYAANAAPSSLTFRQYVDKQLTPLVKGNLFAGNILCSIDRQVTALDLAFAWAMTSDEAQKAALLSGMKLFLSKEIPSAYLSQILDGSNNFTNDMIPQIVAAYATYIAAGKDKVIDVIKAGVVSGADNEAAGNNAWESIYKASVVGLVDLIDAAYADFDYDIVDVLYMAAALQNQEGFEQVLSFSYTKRSFYNSLYNTYLSNGYNPTREGYVFDGWTVEGNFAYPNWKKVYSEVDQVQILGTGSVTVRWHHDEATTFEVYMDGVKQTSTITGSDGYYQTTITGVPNDTDVTIKIVAVQAPSSAFSYTVFGTSENLTIASVDLSSKGTNEYKYKYYDVKHIDVTNKADWYYVADVTDGKMFYFYQQHDYNFGSNVTSLQISDSKFATINGATLSTALYLGTFDLTVNYNDSTTKVYKCTIMPLVEDIEFGSDIKSYIAEKEGNKANSEYLKQRLANADTDSYVIGVLSYSYMSGKYSDYSYVYKDNSGLSWPLYNGFSFKATAKVRANASGVKALDHNSFKFAYTFYESSNNGETWTVNKNLAIYDEINDVFYFNKSADLTKIYKVVVSYNIDGSNIYVPEAYKLEAEQQKMQKEFIFKLNNGVNVFTHKGFKTAFNDKTVECINVHSTIEAEMSLSSLIYIEDQMFIDSFATDGDITLTNGEIDLENITMLKKNSSNPDYQYGEYVWALSDSSDYDIKDSRGNYYKFVGKDSGEYVISDATIVENYKSGKFKISELNPGYSKYITSHYTAGVPYYRVSSQLGSNSLDSGATVEYVADLVVNGNYFAIDGSKLPYYTNNQIVTAGDTMNASGYTVYSSSSGLITCRTNSEYTIKNLTVLSNNITYDEFKSQSSLSRDEIATIAEYMTRTSGCFNGIFVQSPFSTNDGGLDRYFGGEHEYYCYNKYNELELLKSKTKLVLDNVNVYNALIGAYTDTLADCEFSYVSIDNSWSNSIYGYGTRSVSLTMCELGQSGGTAIELDDISVLIKGTCGLGTSPYGDSDYYNPILIVDEYTINHINNKISGGEQWFVAYSMSASAIGLKKILAGVSQNTIVYNDGGVEKMNLVIMEQNTAGLKNLRNNVGGESGLSYNEFDFMNLEFTVKDSSGNPIINKQNVAKRHTDGYLGFADLGTDPGTGAHLYGNGTDTLYYVAGMADVYQMYSGYGLTASVGSMQIFAYVPVNPANVPQN